MGGGFEKDPPESLEEEGTAGQQSRGAAHADFLERFERDYAGFVVTTAAVLLPHQAGPSFSGRETPHS